MPMGNLMDETILDQPIIEQQKSITTYGGFWQRIGAAFLDWVVMVPISLGIKYLNFGPWSPVVSVVLNLIPVIYKPLMEFHYGATVGKMVLRLRVRNLEMEEASLGAIFRRNVFYLIPQVLSLWSTLVRYFGRGIESDSLLGDITTFQYIVIGVAFITVIDVIMMAADPRKRSLHDRIGGTVVVNQP
jgi:uncharacterized RDD family membrane protein YckC